MDKIELPKIPSDLHTQLPHTRDEQNPRNDRSHDRTTRRGRKQIPKRPLEPSLDKVIGRFALESMARRISIALVSIALSFGGWAIPLESSAQSIFSPTLPQFTFGSRTLKLGLAGTDVLELQQRLQRFGYNVPVSGLFDESTEAAAIAFQFDRGLIADGEVGTETQDALGVATSSGFNTGNIRVLQRGDNGDRVLQLQQLLQSAGFRPGPLDGSFGIETEAAVIDFQLATGLSPTGIVDAQTEVLLQQSFNSNAIQPFVPGQLAQESNVYAVVVPVRQSIYAPALLQGIRQFRPDAILVESFDRGAYINAGTFRDCDLAEDFAEQLRDGGYEANVAYFTNREFFARDGQTPFSSYSSYGLTYPSQGPVAVPTTPLPRRR